MSWIGRIMGTLVGFGMGLWLGALIGFFAGYYFDKALKNFRSQYTPERRRQVELALFHTIFPLLGRMAKADGRVSEDEIQAAEIMMDRMRLTPEMKEEAKRLFKTGVQSGFDVRASMEEFIQVSAHYPHLKQLLLVYLITMAMSDNHLHDSETQVLREVASSLGYSEAAFAQLLRMIQAQSQFQHHYNGSSSQENIRENRADQLALAYQALGVSAESSDEEVKRAYRKLMSQYHPDKLAGQGVPDDVIKVATERSQEIQTAYELIKKSRA